MTDYLLLIFLFLGAGVFTVPVASRLGLGSVLGYLIAGIALSPLLHALQVDVVAIQHFAEFGVVMMLFLVGLELEPDRLWAMRSRLLGLGGLQVLGTTAAITALTMALGQPWSIALAAGLVLSLSSTAIVLQTLNERGLMNCEGGRASFSVLLFQDIAVIPMLAFIPLLALPELSLAPSADVAMAAVGEGTPHAPAANGGHGGGEAMSLVAGLSGWQRMLVTLSAIAGVIFIGRRVTPYIFRFIGVARLRELFTAAALMIVVAIALLMALVGLSPALGTFLAGVVLAESEYRHELEADIDPFKGLLLGLFFITVGANIDFGLLAAEWSLVLGLTLCLMLVKFTVLQGLAQIFSLRGTDRWLLAFGLAQAGEFGFVLLAFTVANGVIPGLLADRLLLVVALSMLLTPVLFILYDRLIVPRYAVGQEQEADDIDRDCDIIVAGHGRFGGIVNRMLRGAGFETTVVDYSSSQLEMLRTFGFEVYFGDATRPDLLHAAGIDKARLLVIAIDNKQQITELTRYIIEHYPKVHVLARAVDRLHVYDLYSVGCRDIIRETYDSSIRAGRSAFEALGFSREEAVRMAGEFEKVDRQAMLEVAPLYDINIPPMENAPYVQRVKELRAEWEAQLRGRMNPPKPTATEAAQAPVPRPEEGA
ncbi:MAG: cation:proton antiporter [Pseudomonadota bacterium]